MSQVDRIYKRAFCKNFTNHAANFPLSQGIRLGDYGVMKNGYFVKVGNLASLPGFELKEIKDDFPTNEEFRSSNEISVKSTAKGDLTAAGIPAIKATLDISFAKEDSVFFSSSAVRYNELDNLPQIGEKILNLYKAGKWEKRHIVVTKVMTASRTVIVIGGSSNSGVTIEADVPAIERINLNDLGVNFRFSKSDKVSYQIIADQECQLGFGLSRLYNPFFLKPTFKNKDNNIHLFAAMDESREIDNGNLAFGDMQPVLQA